MIVKRKLSVFGRQVEGGGLSQEQFDGLLDLGNQLGRRVTRDLLRKFFGKISRKDLTEQEAEAATTLMRNEIAILKRGGRSPLPALRASLGRHA